jgi:hypothetical protein
MLHAFARINIFMIQFDLDSQDAPNQIGLLPKAVAKQSLTKRFARRQEMNGRQ